MVLPKAALFVAQYSFVENGDFSSSEKQAILTYVQEHMEQMQERLRNLGVGVAQGAGVFAAELLPTLGKLAVSAFVKMAVYENLHNEGLTLEQRIEQIKLLEKAFG